MKRKLKVGVIGVGGIAQARHIPHLRNNASVNLVALCDIKYAGSYVLYYQSIPKLYDDYHEMIAEEKLDLVDICTPPKFHIQQCIDCLEAGCNILVEKPITLTLNDCDKILDVAQRMKKEVCVIHSSLFFPSMIRASHKLSELGTLDSIRVLFDAPERFLVAKWIKEMPAGIMDEVMPHVAYIVNAFVQPKDATVFRSKSKWSGHEHCTIVFENEIPCIVDINFGEDWEFKVFIEGSRKSMQIDILNQFLSVKNNRNIPRNKFGVLRNWSEKLFADVNQIFSNTTDSFRPFGHEYVIKKYISHLLDSNNPTPVSAEDIREVVRITQMVNKKFVEET